MTSAFHFKLRRRVFRYRGAFRWIITDATQAYGTVIAHGVRSSTKEARREAGLKIIEIKRNAGGR